MSANLVITTRANCEIVDIHLGLGLGEVHLSFSGVARNINWGGARLPSFFLPFPLSFLPFPLPSLFSHLYSLLSFPPFPVFSSSPSP